MPFITCTAMTWNWWGHGFVFRNIISFTSSFCHIILLCTRLRSISFFNLPKHNNDIISVRHQRVEWMRTEGDEIPALGTSAYLLVCRRHASLLAFCNTHSGWGGAGSVREALAVASCPGATAAAQHVTPLDDVAACCATVRAGSILRSVGGTPCCHYSGPSCCCTGGLCHKHGHPPGGASCYRDS